MWEYSDKVLDHYRNPRNVGKIDDADLIGEAGSLACGDSLKLYIKLDGKVIKDAKFQTFGCGSAVASSSILTEMIIGKTIDEAAKITNKDIADELDGLPQEKMHCSVMGHEALEDAIKKYYGEDVIAMEEGLNPSGEKIICTCFNVTENQIWEAIKVNGLKTVDEVTNYTKAGGACGRCRGVKVRLNGEIFEIRADYTILASGGIGGLYEHSTNYPHITGDAIEIAKKHGIKLEHLDYVQFHPTTLYSE